MKEATKETDSIERQTKMLNDMITEMYFNAGRKRSTVKMIAADNRNKEILSSSSAKTATILNVVKMNLGNNSNKGINKIKMNN